MRPDEQRTFEENHAVLDPCDAEQLALWAARYQVQPDELREICAQVGGQPDACRTEAERAASVN